MVGVFTIAVNLSTPSWCERKRKLVRVFNPCWCVRESKMQELSNLMGGLTAEEQSILQNNPAKRIVESVDYLASNNGLSMGEKIGIIRSHINVLVPGEYRAFVESYAMSNDSRMWWENEEWLDTNFLLNSDLGDNQLSNIEFNLIKKNPVGAYSASNITSVFKIGIHKKITRYAAENAGLSQQFIDISVIAVEETDLNTLFGLAPNTAYLHFDGLTSYNAVLNNYNLVISKIIPIVNKSYVNHNDVFKVAGLSHALQDFYAHSNYTELAMQYFPKGSEVPTFTQVLNNPSQYAAFISVLEQSYPAGLHTGIFTLYNHFFEERSKAEYPADWDKSHSGMSKDEALGEVGRLAAALAYKETHYWFMKFNNKSE